MGYAPSSSVGEHLRHWYVKGGGRRGSQGTRLQRAFARAQPEYEHEALLTAQCLNGALLERLETAAGELAVEL